MKKIIYYIRIVTFIIYLITLFLLVDVLIKANNLSIWYFILSIIYSFVMILTILSKKKIWIDLVSYNILNIGIYFYNIIIYFIVARNTRLDILNNELYFKNNLFMMIILLITTIIFTLSLNKENDTNH